MKKTDIKRAGVMGWPISHSLSPRIHNFWFKEHRIKASYDALAVMPADLENALRSLPENGFVGVNLTIPHKERALAYLDEVDESAQRIGAINTVVVDGGKLRGINTDAYGFIQNLHAQTQNIPVGKALILGAGGAARAVCAALLDAQWHVTIAARTVSKAEAIKENLKSKSTNAVDWEHTQSAMEDKTLLVNTTPLGMKGQPPLDISLDALPLSATVCDIVYSPLKTLLLTQAEVRGNRIVTGLGMLLYQAQAAFEAWFAVRPEVTKELELHVLEGRA